MIAVHSGGQWPRLRPHLATTDDRDESPYAAQTRSSNAQNDVFADLLISHAGLALDGSRLI
jgi:hypothetical protein